MKKLFLVRYAQSTFGKLGDFDIYKMIGAATREGLDDVDRNVIDHAAVAGLLTPLLSKQTLLAGIVASDPALLYKPVVGLGNACDSGSMAVLDCARAILAGTAHVGMAIGIEKMHPLEGKLDSKAIGLALGTAAHKDDRFPPFTFPHAFATIMDTYMKTWGLTEEDMAVIPPIFYDNASHNPLAHMKQTKAPVTAEAVLGSYRLFQEPKLPLKLYECSQISDGWARILVCDEEGLKRLGVDRAEATELAGFGMAVDTLSIEARGDDLVKPIGARKAFVHAMDMAGAAPTDISVQEVHDCFSVMAALAVETTGLADPGKGVKWFADGEAKVGGKCPINTSGGLIAKGHPISATGVAMIGWIHQQLTGKVPAPLQVADASLGTTLNIGGPICSTVVTVQKP
jgi:acetyl-CoA C-acetyltransferase